MAKTLSTLVHEKDMFLLFNGDNREKVKNYLSTYESFLALLGEPNPAPSRLIPAQHYLDNKSTITQCNQFHGEVSDADEDYSTYIKTFNLKEFPAGTPLYISYYDSFNVEDSKRCMVMTSVDEPETADISDLQLTLYKEYYRHYFPMGGKSINKESSNARTFLEVKTKDGHVEKFKCTCGGVFQKDKHGYHACVDCGLIHEPGVHDSVPAKDVVSFVGVKDEGDWGNSEVEDEVFIAMDEYETEETSEPGEFAGMVSRFQGEEQLGGAIATQHKAAYRRIMEWEETEPGKTQLMVRAGLHMLDYTQDWETLKDRTGPKRRECKVKMHSVYDGVKKSKLKQLRLGAILALVKSGVEQSNEIQKILTKTNMEVAPVQFKRLLDELVKLGRISSTSENILVEGKTRKVSIKIRRLKYLQ